MALDQLIVLLDVYKYFILFPIIVVEGPITTVIAGFLASLGHLNVYVAYAVIVVADLVGDSLYYLIGYHGGRRVIDRWGRYVGITMGRIERVEKHFEHHAGKTLIAGKLSDVFSAVVIIAAGMAKVPYRRFILNIIIPTLPKSLILLLIGYYFGQAYNRIKEYMDYTALWTVAVVAALIIIYFIIRKVGKKYEYKDV